MSQTAPIPDEQRCQLDQPVHAQPCYASTSTSTSTPSRPSHDTKPSSSLTASAMDVYLSHTSCRPFHDKLLLTTGLVWMSESMEMLLISFISPELSCTFPMITPVSTALLTTFAGIGMLVGNLLWGSLSDLYGRRYPFIASATLAAACGLCSAFASSFAWLLLARFGVGLGIGGSIAAVTIVAEFAPTHRRGQLAIALAVFWAVGAAFEAAVAWVILPRFMWRVLVAVSTLPLVAVCCVVPYIPESPVWLVSQGRMQEAKRVLRIISRDDEHVLTLGDTEQGVGVVVDVNDHEGGVHVQNESMWLKGSRHIGFIICFLYFISAFLYYGMVLLQPEMLSLDPSSSSSHCIQFNSPKLTTTQGKESTTRTSIFPLSFSNSSSIPSSLPQQQQQHHHHQQQQYGIPSITMSTQAIQRTMKNIYHEPTSTNPCSTANKLSNADYAATFWSSLGELPGVLLSVPLVSILGRRPLIAYTLALLSVTFALLQLCVPLIVQSFLFFLARGLSLGSFQSIILLCSETYAPRARSSAMGVASACSRVGLLFTPFVAQALTDYNVSLALAVYTVVAAVGVFACVAYPVETSGRPGFNSMHELVGAVKEGKQLRKRRRRKTSSDLVGSDAGGVGVGDGCERIRAIGFKHDPSVSKWVRWLRWSAVVDGIAVDHGKTNNNSGGDVSIHTTESVEVLKTKAI